jgi:acetyl esterase/lipase
MTVQKIEDIPYRTIGSGSLLARLYRTAGHEPAPWVIDVHGGAWMWGDRLDNAVIHADLAAHGIGVFAVDFRSAPNAQYPVPIEDISYGIRWFKANAKKLGVNVYNLGGLALSSGGQQMGLVALRPSDDLWTKASDVLQEVDASLDFFVGCWPILDPLARYRMAQMNGNDQLVAAHHAYFPDEKAMAQGNPYLLLERGEATHLPPMIVIQGTADTNVEHERVDAFAELYCERGGDIAVHKFAGQPHAFITKDPDAAASREAIRLIREFVLAQVAG